MLERLLWVFVRRRTATLTAAGVLFVVAAASLPGLRLDDSPERWMPKSSVRAWKDFDRHFAHPDTVVAVMHFREEVRDSDREYLAGVRRSLAAIPGVRNVIDVSRMAIDVEDAPLTEMLKRPDDGGPDRYAMYRGVLFDDPQQWREGGESAGLPRDRTMIMYLELETGRKSVERSGTRDEEQQLRRSIVDEIYGVLADNARPDVDGRVIGAIVIQHELERIARKTMWVLAPASLVLTLLILGAGFRSFAPILTAVTAVTWSATLLLAGIVWAGWSLNVVTIGGPTLMFVIVLATTIHFAHSDSSPNLTLEHAARDDGNRLSDESRQVVRWVAVPCLGAAVTTGVGFLMLAFNELAPTRELGVELLFGAVLAFCGVFVMRLWLPKGRPVPGRWLSPAAMDRVYGVMVARPRLTIAGTFLLIGGLAASASQIETDADPFSFFHRDSQMAQTFDHVRERKFGMYLLDVALVPKRPEGEAPAVDLTESQERAAREFQRKIAGRPEVRNVVSTLDLKERINAMFEARSNDGLTQRDFESIRIFENTFTNWTTDQTGENTLRMTFKVDDPGTGLQNLIDEVRRELPEDEFHCIYTGTAADVVVLAEGLVGGMTRGLATAFLVMAVVCGFWFRSLRLTLIAFLPNVFPVLFILGVMGAFGVPLNSGSAMVATIALGVALNDTVHFIMHYRGRRLEGEATERALRDTYTEIGRPIVLTSIVSSLGFAIFLLSDFRPMWDFGLLTGVAMLAALIGDLVLLPSLLLVFDRDRREAGDG